MDASSLTASNRCAPFAVGAVLTGWFSLALAGSLLGAFDSPAERPPMLIGAAALLPVVAFVIAYLVSETVRRLVATANVPLLTLAQTWRAGGIVFVILYLRGVLPGGFALPAGLGDMAIGGTAPFVAWAVARGTMPKPWFVLWNVLGIVDLVLAVTLGVLSSQSPWGILASDATTRPMGQFPLSLIPTFFVPALTIFHLVVLARVRREG